MSGHSISARTYIIVCALLILLTFATVGVSLLDLQRDWHMALGLIIALCKGTLVVLFFMHALISSRVTIMVIVVSVFWLVVILMGLTLTDYYSRGLVPFMPGH